MKRVTSLCSLAPAILSLALFGCREDSSVGRWALGLAIPQDTIYAPSYSEEAFARVIPGMSQEQVKALIGEPLEISEQSQGAAHDPFRRRPATLGHDPGERSHPLDRRRLT